MLNDLQLFTHIADAGSLTKASEQLNLPLPTLSRRIHKLEQHLNCLLFKRSTKGLMLTNEGSLYYDSCVWHIRELTRTLNNIDDSLNSLEGDLHILAPPNFALKALQEFWTLYIQKYPQIKLRLDLDMKIVDFNQVPADLAIRIGELPNSALIQTKLGFIPTILVCAPTILVKKDISNDINQLLTYPTIKVLDKEWKLTHTSGASYSLQKIHDHHTNDISFASHLAQSGAGIAMLPMSEVYHQLNTGTLVHIFPKWQGERRPLSLIRASRHHYSIRAQSFHNELSQFIKQQVWVIKGST